MDTFLSIKNLSVGYNGLWALKNVNLEISKGEIISIIGPNGSGKSTLIKSILGLITHTGEIFLEGKPSKHNLKMVSYMPKSEDIDINFPITVEEVVMQSQYAKNNVDAKKMVEDAIKLNELEKLKDKNLNELSGGQLQRTFLSRAIAQ